MLKALKFGLLALLLPIISIPFIIYTKKASTPEKNVISTQPVDTKKCPNTKKAVSKSAKKSKKNLAKAPAKKSESQASAPMVAITPATNQNVEQGITKMISINNSIEKQMLGYKHWTGRYYPTKFVLSFNGKVIENGKTETVTIDTSKPLVVRYEYEFLNGRKHGWRNIEFNIKPEAEKLTVTFNWLSDHHVFIDNANVIKSYAENI